MNASPLGPDWHPAGNAADFEDEDVEQIWVGQLAVAVYKADGQFYATQDVCTHEHAYLDCKADTRCSRREQAQTDRRIYRPGEFINVAIEHRENAKPQRLAGAGSNA